MEGGCVGLVPNVYGAVEAGGGYAFLGWVKGDGEGPIFVAGKLIPFLAVVGIVFVGGLVVGGYEEAFFLRKNFVGTVSESMDVSAFFAVGDTPEGQQFVVAGGVHLVAIRVKGDSIDGA